MSERVCDDVEYRYNEATEMLFIWLSNDDRYYTVPKRAAKYDFGRSPDKEDKKAKLLIGLYREPYLDGWKYTVSGKQHPDLVKVIFDYINYGRYIDENGNRIVFTYLRHNRKALGIHYLIERYCRDSYKKPGTEKRYFRETNLVPFFPTPEQYDGHNFQPCKYIAKNYYKHWQHEEK